MAMPDVQKENQITILVVDDTPISLRLLVDLLTDRGYTVRPALSGEAALLEAQTVLPDLILLDIMMPDLDGYEVCQQLKSAETTRDIPVIFVSALDQTFDKVKGFEVGGIDYITKPFQVEEVLARVETHLSLRRLQKQVETQNAQLMQEIAFREEAQEILRESEARYRLISETVSSIAYVYHVDEDGQLTRAWATDAAAKRVTGYSYAEVDALGGWLNLIHPDDLAAVHRHNDLLRRGDTSTVEYRLITKDGEICWIRDFARPLWDEAKQRVTSLYGGCQDITEQKQLEEQLRQSQKMEAIGHLAGGVAHHFNNLLTTIMGYVDLSLTELPADHTVTNDLQIIRRTTQRAATLTRQLLAFTRKQVIQPTLLDLNELVRSTESMLRQLINESIELETELATELAPIKMDASQLEQLLVNFVVNARDAMPDGGRLSLATKSVDIADQTTASVKIPRGHYVQLSVTDTGTGMTKEVQDRIFEPFFTTKEVGQGTGLGLSTCFGIVKQHNGYITVDSQPGQGTTINIYLPALEKPVASSTVEIDQHLPTGQETILLVEDEVNVRELAGRILRQQGYTVWEAGDGQEALSVITEQSLTKLDLLVADVVMPKLGGIELATRLIADDPHLKILLMSGYTDGIIGSKEIRQLNGSFLLKPFTRSKLTQSVRNALDETTK